MDAVFDREADDPFADLELPPVPRPFDEDDFELAAFACFDFVGSAWSEAVRLVPPEFVRFDMPDFSAAARLAEARLALVVFLGLLVDFVVMSVCDPPFVDDREVPFVVAAMSDFLPLFWQYAQKIGRSCNNPSLASGSWTAFPISCLSFPPAN